MNKKIVIIGGVAGGASFAARMRRLDEEASITMFEKGPYISFANCGLPYHIGETIGQRDALLLQTPEKMGEKFNMDIFVNTEVVSIDRQKKTVVYKGQGGNEGEISYDYLVMSPGASPIVPKLAGLDEAKNVFTLRNVPDTDKIKSYIKENDVKKVVVVGGGFIGLEMMENLVELGIQTTLVEMSNQVMPLLDMEMANQVHEHIIDNGVNVLLSDGLSSFENQGKTVVLSSGKKIETDMTILSIGVRPENKLAKDAGLELGEKGGILVNDNLTTTIDDSIFAIGDAIEVKDYISNESTIISLAWPANRQGRMVADNIFGEKHSYRGSLGTGIAKVFDLTAGSLGNNEKMLKKRGAKYQAIHFHPSSHASYYPGAFPMNIKVLFDPKTKMILGAQAIGYENVDKFIDVIATAVYANIPVDKLQNLQLAYAPPYSSAKSPANFAGYIAENILTGKVETIQHDQVAEYVQKGYGLLDVSEVQEHTMGNIDGSINIPLGELRQRMGELEDRPYIVYCRVGLRGYIGVRLLIQYDKKAVNLDGGYKTWSIANFDPSTYKPFIFSNGSATAQDTSMQENANQTTRTSHSSKVVEINACGLQCPGPIMQVYNVINEIEDGDRIKISVTDPGFTKDIESWCKTTGNQLISLEKEKNSFVCVVQKGLSKGNEQDTSQNIQPTNIQSAVSSDAATLVVFSGDMDKAMASMIIASGAAAMGKKVTMFFTFWGLSIIKKPGVKVQKTSMEKMFDLMLPDDASSLPLSKMNMGGMGGVMMKKVMAEKNVDSLQTLIKNAQNVGVKFLACAMSMDVMGIKEEELMDGVEVVGVATYLSEASKGNINLFI